jgi:predicted glycoside hydrolase/deacetylase ChbG (UPF0249 family)
MLIVNADDWGRSVSETDSALECVEAGRVTSVTAMVFMADSERAARLAREAGVPVGLHLNLCEGYSGDGVPADVVAAQSRVLRFLNSHKYSLLLYHPGLRRSFARVYRDQVSEFQRLYGQAPTHVDGHRHKHLSTNVLIGNVIPRGQKIRRGFFFWPHEKGFLNRAYRRAVDWRVARRYVTTDYFFSLAQCYEEERLDRVLALAESSNVEMMCHPANKVERGLLLGDDFGQRVSRLNLGSYRQVRARTNASA